MNLSKLTTVQLEKKIADGKIPADQIDDANTLLLKRKGAVKVTKIKKEDTDFIAAGEKVDIEFVPKKDKQVDKTASRKGETKNRKKVATVDKKKPTKKEKVEPAAKKEKAPKVVKEKVEKGPKTVADYNFDTTTISGLVKTMLMPKKGSTVAGCTYGEANKAVMEKFGRKLHTSEFQRNYDNLADIGILTEKLPPRFKNSTDEKDAEKKDA